jgi:hypothetical protein
MWITATRFTFASTAAALAAAPHALRFWATWARVPGAIGLSVRYQPARRAAWTLSAWRQPSDLEAFLRSPAHRALVRAFSHRLDGTSRGWESPEFDLGRGWRQAVTLLTPV